MNRSDARRATVPVFPGGGGLSFEVLPSGQLREVCGDAAGLHGVEAEVLEHDVGLLFGGAAPGERARFEAAVRRHEPFSLLLHWEHETRLFRGAPREGGVVACFEVSLGVRSPLLERPAPGEATRFQAVFDHSFQSMLVLRDYRVELCNRAFLSLFGFKDLGEVLGRSVQDFVAPASLAMVQGIMRRRTELDDRSELAYEMDALRADGSSFRAEVRSSVFEHDGKRYVLAMQRDVSELRSVEQELAEHRERLVLAMGLARLGWWELDLVQRTLRFGEELHDLLRTDADRAPSPMAFDSFVRRFIAPEAQRTAAEAFLRAATTGDAPEFELPFVRADGTRGTLQSRVFARRDVAGRAPAVFGISRDVSEQHEAARRQQELEAQLRQAQKMESLGTLAGGVAHDFNNVLTAILSIAEVAQLDHADDAPLVADLEQIIGASRRAGELVRRILTFSRRTRAERHAQLLAPLVDETLRMLRSTLPATLMLEVRLDPDVAARIEPSQMQQVVGNLVTTAAQAPQGRPGLPTLKLERRASEQGASAAFSVHDTGAGMDTATRERVFDPFFTTKAPGEGTGLGLSVVFGIVQDHEGSVTVDSAPGRGSTFTVLLPAVDAVESEAAGPSVVLPHGANRRVLLVDDEPLLVDSTRRLMERLGFRVTAFTDATLALRAFEATPDAWDVVLTDLTMPELTGLDLARRVHTLRPKLPVWLTSGYSAALDAVRLKEAGISGLLGKPLSASSFVGW